MFAIVSQGSRPVRVIAGFFAPCSTAWVTWQVTSSQTTATSSRLLRGKGVLAL